jgi:hypothetical protein
MRAAAAMRVEIKDEHGAGARVERCTGGEDETIERAVSRSAGSPRVVMRQSASALVGSAATSSIPPMGWRASDSAIHPDFRVVAKE